MQSIWYQILHVILIIQLLISLIAFGVKKKKKMFFLKFLDFVQIIETWSRECNIILLHLKMCYMFCAHDILNASSLSNKCDRKHVALLIPENLTAQHFTWSLVLFLQRQHKTCSPLTVVADWRGHETESLVSCPRCGPDGSHRWGEGH